MKITEKELIRKLTIFGKNLSHHSQFHCPGRGVDNSRAIVHQFNREIKRGEYFLCDCIGNTVNLCKKTDRWFKNADDRLVPCKVICTIVEDARKQLGSPVNNEWEIPYHLIENL